MYCQIILGVLRIIPVHTEYRLEYVCQRAIYNAAETKLSLSRINSIYCFVTKVGS
jgi:hypothetical protein